MKKTMKKMASNNRKTRKTLGGHLMLFEHEHYEQIKIIDLGVIGDFDIKISSHAFKHLDTFDDFKDKYHPYLAKNDDVYENSSLLEYYYNYKLNGYDKSEKNSKPTLNPDFTGPFSEFVKEILTTRIKGLDLNPVMFDTNYKGPGPEPDALVEPYETNFTVNSIIGEKTVHQFVIYIRGLAILYESDHLTDGKLNVNKKGNFILTIRSIYSTSSRRGPQGPARYGPNQGHYSKDEIFPLEKRPTPKNKTAKKESTKKKLLSLFKKQISLIKKKTAKEKREKEEEEKKKKQEEQAVEDKKASKEWVLSHDEAKRLAAEKTKDSKKSRPTDKEREAKSLSDLDAVINESKGKKRK